MKVWFCYDPEYVNEKWKKTHLICCSVPHDDPMARIEKIFYDTGAHDAQTKESKL